MKTAVASAVLGILFLWTGTASAQKTHTIKLKNSVEGGSVAVTKEDKTTVKMKITDPTGKILADKNDTTTTALEFTETTLKRKDAEAPTLLERQYTKANGGMESLAGKNVVIEKKDGSYTFTFKGGEAVPGQAAGMLKKEFANKTAEYLDMNQLMVPKTAVKVGETWNPDLAPITKALSSGGMLDIDTAKATLVGKTSQGVQEGRQAIRRNELQNGPAHQGHRQGGPADAVPEWGPHHRRYHARYLYRRLLRNRNDEKQDAHLRRRHDRRVHRRHGYYDDWRRNASGSWQEEIVVWDCRLRLSVAASGPIIPFFLNPSGARHVLRVVLIFSAVSLRSLRFNFETQRSQRTQRNRRELQTVSYT